LLQLKPPASGTEYWNEIINFNALVKWGTISEEDLNLFRFFDDADSAFEFLRNELTKLYVPEQPEHNSI
jgi:predicted Rossmann-fold nucleotide-binding protein